LGLKQLNFEGSFQNLSLKVANTAFELTTLNFSNLTFNVGSSLALSTFSGVPTFGFVFNTIGNIPSFDALAQQVSTAFSQIKSFGFTVGTSLGLKQLNFEGSFQNLSLKVANTAFELTTLNFSNLTFNVGSSLALSTFSGVPTFGFVFNTIGNIPSFDALAQQVSTAFSQIKSFGATVGTNLGLKQLNFEGSFQN